LSLVRERRKIRAKFQEVKKCVVPRRGATQPSTINGLFGPTFVTGPIDFQRLLSGLSHHF
jgi:hypothetical protein